MNQTNSNHTLTPKVSTLQHFNDLIEQQQDTIFVENMQQPMKMKQIINQQLNYLKQIYKKQNNQLSPNTPPKY